MVLGTLSGVLLVVLIGVSESDPIPNTNVDNMLLAVAAIATALVLLAAAAKKPPIRQLGRGVGWVFRRLLGDPIAGWLRRELEDQVQPMVAASVQVAVAPLHANQERLAARLVEHMDEEHGLVSDLKAAMQDQVDTVRSHTADDALEFGEIREWRLGADQWRRQVTVALRYLVGEGGPHLDDPPPPPGVDTAPG